MSFLAMSLPAMSFLAAIGPAKRVMPARPRLTRQPLGRALCDQANRVQ
jgi:hypothetical protein